MVFGTRNKLVDFGDDFSLLTCKVGPPLNSQNCVVNLRDYPTMTISYHSMDKGCSMFHILEGFWGHTE